MAAVIGERAPAESRVVAGGDAVGVELLRGVAKEALELDRTVAPDVRVRGFPCKRRRARSIDRSADRALQPGTSDNLSSQIRVAART